MRLELEALQAQVTWLVVLLGALVLMICVVAVLGATVGLLARHVAVRWRARRRPPDTVFYVGRLEAARLVVGVVDGHGVRPLITVTLVSGQWRQACRLLARALAADALAFGASRGGLRRLAQRLAGLPREGFVLERRTVRVSAGRWPLRRWTGAGRRVSPRRDAGRGGRSPANCTHRA